MEEFLQYLMIQSEHGQNLVYKPFFYTIIALSAFYHKWEHGLGLKNKDFIYNILKLYSTYFE